MKSTVEIPETAIYRYYKKIQKFLMGNVSSPGPSLRLTLVLSCFEQKILKYYMSQSYSVKKCGGRFVEQLAAKTGTYEMSEKCLHDKQY